MYKQLILCACLLTSFLIGSAAYAATQSCPPASALHFKTGDHGWWNWSLDNAWSGRGFRVDDSGGFSPTVKPSITGVWAMIFYQDPQKSAAKYIYCDYHNETGGFVRLIAPSGTVVAGPGFTYDSSRLLDECGANPEATTLCNWQSK